tara:strand:- start:234 stop:701 length:468 start_codon:yes stop_codon:yes gene_type:complete
MKKSFTKTKKVKKRIELNKKKDGTYGFDLDKNFKIKIVPGKSIPRGLRYGDKLLSIDGIKINNKSDLDNAIRTRYAWEPADFLFEGLHPISGKYSKKTLSKISEVSSSKEKSKPLKKTSSKSSKKSSSKSSKKSSSKSSRGSKRKSRKLRKSRRR